MTRAEAIKVLNMVEAHGIADEAKRVAIEALKDRPQGEWIADVERWGDFMTTVDAYKCSECGEFDPCKDNFCPNCGADMRGEEE
jgi:hypothetical protein